MAWSNTQKQIAVRACRAAGISEEQRTDMILRHFDRARHKGRITSTSPKLTDQDFAAFMAIVERYAGGSVLHFSAGYWHRAASDSLARMRGRAMRIAGILEAHGKLAPGGAGLAGWIRARVSQGQTDEITKLEYHGMLALILSLSAYAHQNRISLEDEAAASTAPVMTI